MEGGGSSYSDEQSVDTLPDEESTVLRKLRKMKTVRIPKMMVK
jgi:hypothetical protein